MSELTLKHNCKQGTVCPCLEDIAKQLPVILDQQKQELLAALTIEKKDLDAYAQHEYELAKNIRIEGWNACADELSRMKKEI